MCPQWKQCAAAEPSQVQVRMILQVCWATVYHSLVHIVREAFQHQLSLSRSTHGHVVIHDRLLGRTPRKSRSFGTRANRNRNSSTCCNWKDLWRLTWAVNSKRLCLYIWGKSMWWKGREMHGNVIKEMSVLVLLLQLTMAHYSTTVRDSICSVLNTIW